MQNQHVVERIEANPESLYYQEHVARYTLAREHVVPGPLLDIACGSGYGASLLQPACASWVVSVDIDLPALAEAQRNFGAPGVIFLAGNGESIPCRASTFQSISCMETLEHVQDPDAFLRELTRVLRPDGTLILSTPNRLYSEERHLVNPFHIREYSKDELRALLSNYFGALRVFQQGFDNSYHANVRDYASEIQKRKRQLNPALRLLIDRVYRPLKAKVPRSATNFFVRRLLGLSYPQPSVQQIAISENDIESCSNFVVVCRQPLH